ncbi:hypothetical protein D5H75_35610 [Bailinhaonella thermotolerans]|uniref:Uncharacterized protein n=1 Tax=Bailinhaonella thermotolerans TaxID=1070861 RepID=A0A3A4A4A1_9ACTN|nr:hypothetical protein D5H75_35610 [Bailinhaonella thermotolerans]
MALVLAGDRTIYAPGQSPRFTVSMVSMASGTCELPARALTLRITSGHDLIWSSTDCVRPDSASFTLRRGSAVIRTLTWDRRRSTPGCRSPRAAARPGTYVATLTLNASKPHRHVFFLR